MSGRSRLAARARTVRARVQRTGALRQPSARAAGASRPAVALPRPSPLGRSRQQPRAAGRDQQPGLSDLGARGRSARPSRAASDRRAMREQFGRSCSSSLYDQDRPPQRAEDAPHLPPFVARSRPGDDARGASAADALGEALAKRRDRPSPLPRRTAPTRSPYFEPSIAALVDGDRAIARLLVRRFRRSTVARTAASIRNCSTSSSLACRRRLACARPAPSSTTARQGARRIIARSGGAPSSPPRSTPTASSTGSRAASISCCRSRRSTPTRRCDRFLGDDEAQAAALPLPPADGRSRRRQARALRDRPRPARGSRCSSGCSCEKRRELDHQLTMLARATRRLSGRPRCCSMAGRTDAARRRDGDPRRDRDRRRAAAWADRSAPTKSPQARAALIAATGAIDDRFAAEVEVRDDVAAGLMVSGGKLMISSRHARWRATGSTRCSRTRSASTC